MVWQATEERPFFKAQPRCCWICEGDGKPAAWIWLLSGWHEIFGELGKGKRANHNFQWENPLYNYKWPFSIAMLVYQRVSISFFFHYFWGKSPQLKGQFFFWGPDMICFRHHYIIAKYTTLETWWFQSFHVFSESMHLKSLVNMEKPSAGAWENHRHHVLSFW